MRGRKPKPTALKKLAGNPGKRALNHAEPRPEPGVPYCPRQLTPEAKSEWRRVAHKLQALGLMTHLDRAALAAYCQAWADYVEATRELKRAEKVMVTDKGYNHLNPWIGIKRSAAEEMRKFMTEFGMTPSSRTRLHVDAGEEEPSLAELLFDLSKEK